MTQHHIDGKTTKTSAFSQIIEKDSQGVKTLKWSKTPQKYLDKKDNFWLRTLSKRITNWQTCLKLRISTYVKKCNVIQDIFTLTITHTQEIKTLLQNSFLNLSCNQSLCLVPFFSLPFPTYHVIHHNLFLAIVNNASCGHKNTNAKDIFCPLDQNRFRIKLTEKIYKISLCWEEEFILYIPLWKSRGPGRTDAWTTEENC